MEHDRPPGLASAHPGVGALPPRVAHVPDVRVTPAEVTNEVAVLHPHEPLAPALRVLPDQTLGEPRHHPGEVGAPLAVGLDARGVSVRAPQPLRRLMQEGVNVLGDRQVRARAADPVSYTHLDVYKRQV